MKPFGVQKHGAIANPGCASTRPWALGCNPFGVKTGVQPHSPTAPPRPVHHRQLPAEHLPLLLALLPPPAQPLQRLRRAAVEPRLQPLLQALEYAAPPRHAADLPL